MEVVFLLLAKAPLSYQYFLPCGRKILRAIPIAIYEPKSSFAVFATYIAFVTKITYSIITPAETINPISSAISEKIKSVVFGYKKPNCV